MLAPPAMPGAEYGDRASESSRKGFVERGRSGRVLTDVEPVEGERVRFRKGLLEPKLGPVGDIWSNL